MRVVLSLALLVFALSGCVDEPAPEARRNGDDARDVGTPSPVVHDTVPAAVAVTVPWHWNGTLGSFVRACEYESTGICDGRTVREDDNSAYLAGPGVLRGLSLTLTWTAATAATETLGFEVMAMGSCDGCVTLQGIEGTSPLVLALDDLNVTIGADDVVHAYAYNTALVVHQRPVFARVSLEQVVRMDGYVLMEAVAPADAAQD